MAVQSCVDAYFNNFQLQQDNKDDQKRLEHVETVFNDWVKYHEHFPTNYDKNMLRSFIRGANYHIEKTKKKFTNYLRAKHDFPDIFTDRDPFALDQFTKSAHIFVLPQLTPKGERVHIFNIFKLDPSEFHLGPASKFFFMHYDLLLAQSAPVRGEIAIIDCTDFSPAFFPKLVSPRFKHGLNILRDSYACHVRQVHLINPPQLVEKLLSVLGPLIHHKVKERIIIHKSVTGLSDYISTHILPVEFGGINETTNVLAQKWYDCVRKNAMWFQEQDKVMLNGIPPPTLLEKNQNLDEGTFRKLDID